MVEACGCCLAVICAPPSISPEVRWSRAWREGRRCSGCGWSGRGRLAPQPPIAIGTGEVSAGRERPRSRGSPPTLPGLVPAKGGFMFTPRPWSWVRDAHPRTHWVWALNLAGRPLHAPGEAPHKGSGLEAGWGLLRKW